MSLRPLLLALALTVAPAALTPAPLAGQELGIALGEKAPGGPVETLDGRPVDLSAYLGKGPVLLEFWATWCGNCKQLEPTLRKAMATYGKQVRFVTVAVSINQSVERVKGWLAQHPTPGDFVYDRKGVVSAAYDAPATSFVVVIDKTGRVVYTGLGGTQNLDAAIRKAL